LLASVSRITCLPTAALVPSLVAARSWAGRPSSTSTAGARSDRPASVIAGVESLVGASDDAGGRSGDIGGGPSLELGARPSRAGGSYEPPLPPTVVLRGLRAGCVHAAPAVRATRKQTVPMALNACCIPAS